MRSSLSEGSELNLHAPDETESEANAFRQSEVWSTSDDHSYKETKKGSKINEKSNDTVL